MYGAGKLLLKDTVLEMKANRRYGVVGHNGAFEVVELSSSCRRVVVYGFCLFFSNPEVAENVWVNTVEVCLGRQLLMFRGIVTCHPTSREIRGGSMLSKLIHGSIGYSHRNPFVGTGCKL